MAYFCGNSKAVSINWVREFLEVYFGGYTSNVFALSGNCTDGQTAGSRNNAKGEMNL